MHVLINAIVARAPCVRGCNKPNNAHVYSVATDAGSSAIIPLEVVSIQAIKTRTSRRLRARRSRSIAHAGRGRRSRQFHTNTGVHGQKRLQHTRPALHSRELHISSKPGPSASCHHRSQNACTSAHPEQGDWAPGGPLVNARMCAYRSTKRNPGGAEQASANVNKMVTITGVGLHTTRGLGPTAVRAHKQAAANHDTTRPHQQSQSQQKHRQQ